MSFFLLVCVNYIYKRKSVFGASLLFVIVVYTRPGIIGSQSMTAPYKQDTTVNK